MKSEKFKNPTTPPYILSRKRQRELKLEVIYAVGET